MFTFFIITLSFCFFMLGMEVHEWHCNYKLRDFVAMTESLKKLMEVIAAKKIKIEAEKEELEKRIKILSSSLDIQKD